MVQFGSYSLDAPASTKRLTMVACMPEYMYCHWDADTLRLTLRRSVERIIGGASRAEGSPNHAFSFL